MHMQCVEAVPERDNLSEAVANLEGALWGQE